MKKTLLQLMIAGVAVTAALDAAAVPAKRGFFDLTQPDGTTVSVEARGDEFGHWFVTRDGAAMTLDADGYLRPLSAEQKTALRKTAADKRAARFAPTAKAREISDQKAPTHPQAGVGLFSYNFPHEGSPKALVLLVEYADVSFTIENPYDYFNDMLNKEGFDLYGGTGSARDWFNDGSQGRFTPQFDVFGPVKLSQNRSYYGSNDARGDDLRPDEMVLEAVRSLDDQINFADYDTDGDGVVDNVFIYYAGVGEASAPKVTEAIWPHASNLTQAGFGYDRVKDLTFDGVVIDTYGCTNEMMGNRPDGIGTFVHEFSHVLGLPDLYTTDYGDAYYLTPAYYSVLDNGPYLNEGCTPPTYGIFERNAFGWIEPIILDETMDVTLEEIQSSNSGALIPTAKDTEFFLLENRQNIGWDRYLPGHGMLIWHIDYNTRMWNYNTVNNYPTHQYVDIEEAGGTANSRYDAVLASYPWPGTSRKTEFGHNTTPSMATWAGDNLHTTISGITEAGGKINFHVEVVTDGIADIAADEADEADAVYYNLQGARVENPSTGVFIRVAGGKATKVVK